ATAAPQPAAPPWSPRSLFGRTYDGRALTVGRETGSTEAYQQFLVTYEGDGLTVSGRMNVPRGTGPFPAVVLAHGYADPAVYDNSQQMARERDYLARQGYVTLLVDYRNHAQSSRDPDNDANLRVGYAVDVVNAALALQQDARVRPEKIALMGRSMGGGVVFSALEAKPGLFRAAIAYSPVSTDSVDNFNQWTVPDASRSDTRDRLVAQLGTPDGNPAAWAESSPRTYLSRITEPVLVLHGAADLTCPVEWSQATVTAMQQAGKAVEYAVYPGQPHVFTSAWAASIERSAEFLTRHLA
ncbi:MAG: alpha/beta fold hydrolase, partial [Lapillicoccus sp.]